MVTMNSKSKSSAAKNDPSVAPLLRTSCDHCRRVRRGCDGGNPCGRCTAKGVNCLRGPRRKAGQRGIWEMDPAKRNGTAGSNTGHPRPNKIIRHYATGSSTPSSSHPDTFDPYSSDPATMMEHDSSSSDSDDTTAPSSAGAFFGGMDPTSLAWLTGNGDLSSALTIFNNGAPAAAAGFPGYSSMFQTKNPHIVEAEFGSAEPAADNSDFERSSSRSETTSPMTSHASFAGTDEIEERGSGSIAALHSTRGARETVEANTMLASLLEQSNAFGFSNNYNPFAVHQIGQTNFGIVDLRGLYMMMCSGGAMLPWMMAANFAVFGMDPSAMAQQFSYANGQSCGKKISCPTTAATAQQKCGNCSCQAPVSSSTSGLTTTTVASHAIPEVTAFDIQASLV